MTRPIGVITLAVLGFIRGTIGLFGGLAFFGLGMTEAFVSTSGSPIFYFTISAGLFAVSLVTLWLSYGLWTLQSWAWLGMVIVQLLSIGMEILPLFAGGILTTWGAIELALSLLIVLYMMMPGPRAAMLHGQDALANS